MLRALLTGLPVLVLCIAIQALFVGWGVRAYLHLRQRKRKDGRVGAGNVVVLSTVMMVMLIGNSTQIAAWSGLFMLLGEFAQYETALYHSAVNFTTLGYGDVVMSERWRLLGAVEAANGILMFGVSTAVMAGAVVDILKHETRLDDASR